MRRRVLLLGPVLVLGAAGLVAWWWWPARVADQPPPVWTDDLQAAADGNNRFALDLYAQLRDAEAGNLVFSPPSAHTALAMAAAGARGETRDQMARVLHLPADGPGPAAVGGLGRYYAHPRPGYELSAANALWGQKGLAWRAEFLDSHRAGFGAGFREADFAADPDGERRRINRWAAESTRGQVTDLLPDGLLTPAHRLVLANALCFRGAWQDPFDPTRTMPLPFTGPDGTQVVVPMMRREGGFRRYAAPAADRGEPEFQVAELPYRGGELALVVVLPGRHDGLPALEAGLSAGALAEWLAAARPVDDDDLYLPRFRLEADPLALKGPLERLGMGRAFDPAAADFGGMHAGGERLHLDAVMQRTVVEVTEEGTAAAAATAAVIREADAGHPFRADHPFLFLIRDTRHGTILFLGRVRKP